MALQHFQRDIAPVEISIVSPVYRASECVDELVARIIDTVSRIVDSFEIILVDDRSPDNSWDLIRNICASESRVTGVRLSRNFGQHYAITAGIEAARGNYIVVMDCDLQDDPEYITELYAKAKEGYEIVFTEKQQRAHSWLKNAGSRMFYSILAWLSRTASAKRGFLLGNYSIITRKVAKAFLQFNDYHRHYIPVLLWLGFRSTHIPITHQGRFDRAESSYTFPKLVALALNGVVAQSDRLLYLSISLGFMFVGCAMIGVVVLIYQYIFSGLLPGWPSVMVTLLLASGLILMSLGILGMYLGKTFEQTKRRPLFVVDEVLKPSTEFSARLRAAPDDLVVSETDGEVT